MKHEGHDWIKDDVTFFNDAGNCDIENAIHAVYHPGEQAVEIFECDIDELVKVAQSEMQHDGKYVEKDSLKEAFQEITEKLKLNFEKKAEAERMAEEIDEDFEAEVHDELAPNPYEEIDEDFEAEVHDELAPNPYAEAGIPAPGSYQTNDPTDEYGTYQPAENDDLRAENDSLKAENAALKAENAALKAENDSLSESIRSAKFLNEAYEAENDGLKQQLESGQGLEQE